MSFLLYILQSRTKTKSKCCLWFCSFQEPPIIDYQFQKFLYFFESIYSLIMNNKYIYFQTFSPICNLRITRCYFLFLPGSRPDSQKAEVAGIRVKTRRRARRRGGGREGPPRGSRECCCLHQIFQHITNPAVTGLQLCKIIPIKMLPHWENS